MPGVSHMSRRHPGSPRYGGYRGEFVEQSTGFGYHADELSRAARAYYSDQESLGYFNYYDYDEDDDNDDGYSSAAGGHQEEEANLSETGSMHGNESQPRYAWYPTETVDEIVALLSKMTLMATLSAFLKDLKYSRSGKKDVLCRRAAQLLHDTRQAGDAAKYNEMVAKLNKLIAEQQVNRQQHTRYPFVPIPNAAKMQMALAECELFRFEFGLPSPWVVVSQLTSPILTSRIPADAFPLEQPIEFPSAVSRAKGIAADRLQARLCVLRLCDEPQSGESPQFRFALDRRFICNVIPENHPLRIDARPADITAAVRKARCLRFADLPSTPVCYYVVALEVVSDSVQWIELHGKPRLRSIEEVLQEFARQAKADVAAESVTLSLRCPYSMVRLKQPVRTLHCKHLQCFEMKSWTALGSWVSSETTNCLVCNARVLISEMFIDGFVQSVLDAVDDSVDEVSVNVIKGTWSVSSASGDAQEKGPLKTRHH